MNSIQCVVNNGCHHKDMQPLRKPASLLRTEYDGKGAYVVHVPCMQLSLRIVIWRGNWFGTVWEGEHIVEEHCGWRIVLRLETRDMGPVSHHPSALQTYAYFTLLTT